MNKENCALELVDEIIVYYDARSKRHQKTLKKEYGCYWDNQKKNGRGGACSTHKSEICLNNA